MEGVRSVGQNFRGVAMTKCDGHGDRKWLDLKNILKLELLTLTDR